MNRRRLTASDMKHMSDAYPTSRCGGLALLATQPEALRSHRPGVHFHPRCMPAML